MRIKIYLLVSMMVMCFAFAKAQRGIRVGYVDMEYILESVPEYQKASEQLEQRMQGWKTEIEKMESEIGQMETSLKNERVLLTKELIEEREEEITIKRDALNEYQQKRFGAKGDFIIQKQQLIQPVQDQVFNEMQKIGEQKKYDMILERSETTMLYSDDRHDLSDDVLKAIGRTGKREDREERNQARNAPAEAAADEPYMSVQEADDRQEKVAAKEAIVDEREAARAEKYRLRDSIKEAKAREYKERRDAIIKERQRRKDSVLAARKAARENKGNNNPPGGE
ncbi:periplasmic chaperone for outer membrane proteins Skp [Nonlabens sp. Hel1_33_55]|uniref:OmpH family outer membrane protein n=1 Tax=Nonlabens sp. Hel1_33_55 TaxID=1336802 RepID=UPI000875CE93|nr:OmpH family outer membrane protein [Nonlabens sp. Hel1_33_55]SCY37504.1 periplasmic chaperone for outer membrane proteins Skp [Nonlabens sp. Hel1_33_55]